MTTRELQDEIIRLKKEKDICILAHAYQSHDIWEVADYVGDSYGLAVEASTAPQKNVIMSGVRFMAETVKTLSSEKNVYLSNPMAGCPMAQQMDRETVLELRKQYPNAAVVAYINTTSELKTAVDVCVTSSSALRIIRSMPEKEILFIPDCNLGGWIAAQCPDKTFHFFQGGCPTHMSLNAGDVAKARAAHPNALLLVHPECLAEVTAQADYVGSTTGIMKFAKESDAKEFIIGTEQSIVQHLQFDCPEKQFYSISPKCVCHNMKMTTLVDLYNIAAGKGGEKITLSDDVIRGAKACIDRMIALGG